MSEAETQTHRVKFQEDVSLSTEDTAVEDPPTEKGAEKDSRIGLPLASEFSDLMDPKLIEQQLAQLDEQLDFQFTKF
jgi:hypothetical protein